MRYAIVINLDYASHPEQSCRDVWQEIRNRMQLAGFRCDGRIFSIETNEEEACGLARNVIDEIESHMDFHEVFLYLKDFYGFDMASTSNLLLPPATAIELAEDDG